MEAACVLDAGWVQHVQPHQHPKKQTLPELRRGEGPAHDTQQSLPACNFIQTLTSRPKFCLFLLRDAKQAIAAPAKILEVESKNNYE